MLADGFLVEMQALRSRGDLHADLPSMRCVGYRQAWEVLDGHMPAAELRDRGIFATRQLAKRQLTWQRNFRDNWTDLAEVDSLAADAEAQVRALVEAALG